MVPKFLPVAIRRLKRIKKEIKIQKRLFKYFLFICERVLLTDKTVPELMMGSPVASMMAIDLRNGDV